MRRQLRPFYTADQLAQVYARPYDYTRWPDHVERVKFTAKLLHDMFPGSVADLSCGVGAIECLAGLDGLSLLGDIAGGRDFSGPILDTIDQIPDVDVFVCSETLEHMEDPDLLLQKIRSKAGRLLLSTPHAEDNDNNPEHYWGWNSWDIKEMLLAAGWKGSARCMLRSWPPHYYTYQIWICS